jgi:hypothetical protein
MRCLVAVSNNATQDCGLATADSDLWLSTRDSRFPRHDSLTAKLLLDITSIVVFGTESHGTNYHILLSDGSWSFHNSLSQTPWPANIFYSFSLYTLGTYRIENIASSISSIVTCLLAAADTFTFHYSAFSVVMSQYFYYYVRLKYIDC